MVSPAERTENFGAEASGEVETHMKLIRLSRQDVPSAFALIDLLAVLATVALLVLLMRPMFTRAQIHRSVDCDSKHPGRA